MHEEISNYQQHVNHDNAIKLIRDELRALVKYLKDDSARKDHVLANMYRFEEIHHENTLNYHKQILGGKCGCK